MTHQGWILLASLTVCSVDWADARKPNETAPKRVGLRTSAQRTHSTSTEHYRPISVGQQM
jgi:hypothetical protein